MSKVVPESTLTVGDVIQRQLGIELHEIWIGWPPVVYAAACAVLRASGAYRFVVSPPNGCGWPRHRTIEQWAEHARQTGRGWRYGVNGVLLDRDADKALIEQTARDAHATMAPDHDPSAYLLRMEAPVEVVEAWREVVGEASTVIADLSEGTARCWHLVCALVELIAYADEASAGFGVPDPDSDPAQGVADVLLRDAGTLLFLTGARVKVLPRMRTPQVGISVDSLTHHLAYVESEVAIDWFTTPSSLLRERLEVLVIPWPFEVHDDAFVAERDETDSGVDAHGFRRFSYRPEESHCGDCAFDPQLAVRLVHAAQRHTHHIDVVVFPELSLSAHEFLATLRALHDEFGTEAPIVVAGVRSFSDDGPALNEAKIGLTTDDADQPQIVSQAKHHRWRLDREQIAQYGLARRLDPAYIWWEASSIVSRRVMVAAVSPWLTVCPLVCEDLARQNPVAPVVRSVAPTLVIALLFDGPQLRSRWAARYASVLADDPGSSVLSVTSLGMALRCVPTGTEVRRTVALWKDPLHGEEEFELPPDKDAVVLSVRCTWRVEWSADGRSDERGEPSGAVERHAGRRFAPRQGRGAQPTLDAWYFVSDEEPAGDEELATSAPVGDNEGADS